MVQEIQLVKIQVDEPLACVSGLLWLPLIKHHWFVRTCKYRESLRIHRESNVGTHQDLCLELLASWISHKHGKSWDLIDTILKPFPNAPDNAVVSGVPPACAIQLRSAVNGIADCFSETRIEDVEVHGNAGDTDGQLASVIFCVSLVTAVGKAFTYDTDQLV
jgi:hypothetical protein